MTNEVLLLPSLRHEVLLQKHVLLLQISIQLRLHLNSMMRKVNPLDNAPVLICRICIYKILLHSFANSLARRAYPYLMLQFLLHSVLLDNCVHKLLSSRIVSTCWSWMFHIAFRLLRNSINIAYL